MTTNDPIHACPKCGAAVPADAPQGLCPRCVLACAAAAAADPPRSATATGEIPSLERVAAAFPALEVIEMIGRGGMGFVFKARQPHLDRFVALKLLPDQLARDPQFTERFNREGRVLARLNHPNIVSVFDFGRTEHFYFLLMEFVDGVNLRQAMQAGRFSPSEALAIVPKICEALQYAHEQGVLHRDIKPENILLDAKGRVKIADFGIAKLVGEERPSVTLTGTGAALGTLHYMAPEQLEKPSEVDHRADIYSLGVVFYEMLTGELPLGRFAPPSAKTPVNPAVDDVVFRTLEKDREKRYQSAGQVMTEVEYLTEHGQTLRPMTPAPGAPAGPRGTLVIPSAAKPRYAFRAFAAAALVGVSLVTPLAVLVGLLTGRGGVAPIELWLSLASVAVPGLGGTLVGWLALNEIRESRGAVRGLPFALFATLTWPLLVLVCATVGGPMVLLTRAGGPGWAHWLSRMVLLFLPAGALAFALWAVHATAQWASQQPKSHERGVLKRIFAGLLVVGIALAMLTRPERLSRLLGTPARVVLPEGAIELLALSRHPGDGFWWGPDGSGTVKGPFTNAGLTNAPGPGEQAVEMLFRTTGLPTGASMPKFEIEGVLSAEGSVDRSGLFHYVARFPAAQRTTTIRAQAATDPWETLGSDTTGPHGGGSISRVRSGRSLNITFLSALEDKATNTVLTLSHNLRDHDVRAVALTIDGEERTSRLVSQGREHLIATFVGLPRERIREFRFQTRPYRWKEFTNVRLSPMTTAGPPGMESLRVPFKVPKGEVATFRVCPHTGLNQPEPPPLLSGYVVAPDDGSTSGEVVLEPISGGPATHPAALEWRMMIATEDSPRVVVGSATLGPLRFLPGAPPLLRAPEGSRPFRVEALLDQVDSRATPTAPSTQPGFSLGATFTFRPRNFSAPRGSLVGGGTNWEEGLNLTAALESQGSRDAGVRPSIRLTVTGVEVRNEPAAPWLLIDCLLNAGASQSTVFRAAAEGFETETRNSRQLQARAGSGIVWQERVEVRLPVPLANAERRVLQEELARALIAHPLEVPVGPEVPLFRQSVADRGMLSVWIRAGTNETTRFQLAPSTPRPSPEDEIQVRLARTRWAEVQKRAEAGQATGLEVSEAERDLIIAEARGDTLVIAGAERKHAELKAQTARTQFEVGLLTRLELQTAEAEGEVAKLRHEEAMKARTSPSLTAQELATTRAAAMDRFRSAQLRLEGIRKEIEVGALPPQGREILEAEAELGIAEAQVRGRVLDAAEVRFDYAERIRVLVEKLHEVGKATAGEVDQARLNEVRAKAALTALQRSP